MSKCVAVDREYNNKRYKVEKRGKMRENIEENIREKVKVHERDRELEKESLNKIREKKQKDKDG